MKRILVCCALVLVGGLALATTYTVKILPTLDSLMARGARLERLETSSAAGEPVTITGRSGVSFYIHRIIQKPTAANSTATVSLTTDGGESYTLYALADATHTQVRVDDLANRVYYANGGNALVNAKMHPVALKEGETFSIVGTTNVVVNYVIEYAVVRP